MLRRFVNWLGPARAWALFLLLAVTGALSLVLQAAVPETPWVVPVQNGLILAWLLGTVVVVASRLDPLDRRMLLVAVGPLVVSLVLGMLFPALWPWFVGAGVGWLVVSRVLARRGVRREYQQAIRHLRRNEYDQAITVMNRLIKTEPQHSAHYRFRAELYRLQGKPRRAIEDYRRVVELEPDSGVGYNGLAEVYLQIGDYEQARIFARQAYEREPGHWVMPYNLGMIEDRLEQSEAALEHLQEALQAGVADSRHRLLIYLWLARAYARLGRDQEAEEALLALRRQRRGLREWQSIFESEQASTLRHVLAADVELARRVFEGEGPQILVARGTSVEAG